MMASSKLKLLLILLVISLAGCGSTDTFRYKMTVEVDTPTGIRSGFAVREVSRFTPSNIPMLGDSRPRWAVTGEAVAVDVGQGGTLYAILPGADGESGFSGRDIDFMFQELRPGKMAGPIELWPRRPLTTRPKLSETTPMLVTFRNANDPRSVEQIAPDRLGTVFGPGIKLRRISIQKTEEAVSSGISTRLSWLEHKAKSNESLSGDDRLSVSSGALADNLNASSFEARN